MYALLKNVLNEFVGDPQGMIDQLENLRRQVYEELLRVAATATTNVVLHCDGCGLAVHPSMVNHILHDANLCTVCAGKLVE
jgi:hypothetical protein